MSVNVYSSFGSPLKRPLLGQSPERSSNVNRMQPATSGYNSNQTSVVPTNADTGSVSLDHRERRDPSQTYLQPLDGPNAADSESPATDKHMRGPSWAQLPNSGQQTGPGRPPGSVPPPIGAEGGKAETFEKESKKYLE